MLNDERYTSSLNQFFWMSENLGFLKMKRMTKWGQGAKPPQKGPFSPIGCFLQCGRLVKGHLRLSHCHHTCSLQQILLCARCLDTQPGQDTISWSSTSLKVETTATRTPRVILIHFVARAEYSRDSSHAEHSQSIVDLTLICPRSDRIMLQCCPSCLGGAKHECVIGLLPSQHTMSPT